MNREDQDQVPAAITEESIKEALGDLKWSIGREGRKWSNDEMVAKHDLLPTRPEVIHGKLYWRETERIRMLAALLEHVGLDAAFRLAQIAGEGPESWRAFFASGLRASEDFSVDDGERSEEETSEPPRSDPSRRTWNYRVIRFDHGDEVEYAIHEVHFRGDKPIAYSAKPATLAWFDTDEPGAPQRLLDRLAECLSKPVLTVEVIRSDQADQSVSLEQRLTAFDPAQHSGEVDFGSAVGRERFWEPAHSRLSLKRRLKLKELISPKRHRKQRRLE